MGWQAPFAFGFKSVHVVLVVLVAALARLAKTMHVALLAMLAMVDVCMVVQDVVVKRARGPWVESQQASCQVEPGKFLNSISKDVFRADWRKAPSGNLPVVGCSCCDSLAAMIGLVCWMRHWLMTSSRTGFSLADPALEEPFQRLESTVEY